MAKILLSVRDGGAFETLYSRIRKLDIHSAPGSCTRILQRSMGQGIESSFFDRIVFARLHEPWLTSEKELNF